jgi:hypothetical protein
MYFSGGFGWEEVSGLTEAVFDFTFHVVGVFCHVDGFLDTSWIIGPDIGHIFVLLKPMVCVVPATVFRYR